MAAHSIYKSLSGEKAVMALYDSMLKRWPTPFSTTDIPTRYGSTFVIASGKDGDPPLILLHGAGSNSLIWSSDVIEYSRHFRVYAVDLLGEPGKSAPNRPSWDGPAYADWLEDVIEALRIEKTRMVGFSQGGWTALKFAINHPERIEKLALLAPGGIVPDKMSFVFKAIPLAMLGRWGIQKVNRMLAADHEISTEVDEALTLIMTHFKTRVGALPIFSNSELQSLTMPVFLFIGAQDVLRDATKITTRMQALVPNLSVCIEPNGGHALLNTTGKILPFLIK